MKVKLQISTLKEPIILHLKIVMCIGMDFISLVKSAFYIDVRYLVQIFFKKYAFDNCAYSFIMLYFLIVVI